MDKFKKPEYLDIIRDQIDRDIKKNNIHQISPTFIGDNLTRAYDEETRFTVSYVKVPHNEKTFVMCCYPDLDELNKMSRTLIDKLNDKGGTKDFLSAWKKISKWNIEIDERLLTPNTPLTVDNGSQFVAVLCHEIGHIMNTFPAHLVNNYRMSKATAGMLNQMLMNNAGRIVLALTLPMYACINGLRIIVSQPGKELNELAADSRVPEQYKPFLIDYTNNHIINNPEVSSSVIKTNEEYDNEQKQGVEFSRHCINMMKRRNAALKIHLSTYGKLNPSPYIAKLSEFMSDIVAPKAITMEKFNYDSFDREYAVAEQKANTVLETSTVTDRDIAILQVDIDAMSTIDDKTYILNTIFDYIEICEKQREKAIKKIKDINKIPEEVLNDSKIKKLNDMKKQVMNTKITNYTDGSEYAVYVKYPKGYEG